MKWIKGRQGTGYEKFKVFEFGFPKFGGMDCYLLRYNVGDRIPVHTDPVPGKRHYRVNFELKKANLGGKLYVKDPIIKFWRFCFFRSDLSRHAVTRINCGQRLVFSLGFAF
jgi:hypothetical protein